VQGKENTCEEEDIEFLQEGILWSQEKLALFNWGGCFLFQDRFIVALMRNKNLAKDDAISRKKEADERVRMEMEEIRGFLSCRQRGIAPNPFM
jgi:hypothetical protein